MESFKNADAGVIVDQLIHKIQEQRDYLSEIDGKIGDGDHGINTNIQSFRRSFYSGRDSSG